MEPRSVKWSDGEVRILDQTALPAEIRWLRIREIAELAEAVSRLAVRGAPALGVTGALGVVLAVRQHTVDGRIDEGAVRKACAELVATRPTAVNLAKGVLRCLDALPRGSDAVTAEAMAVLAENENATRVAAKLAADIVEELCGPKPLRLLTHCNTGWLATVVVGTALGAITELARRGRVEQVLVDETRPLLQGSRLTAWELRQANIPHRVCVDSAAAYAMRLGMVDCVLVGADRITVEGDVANKIGTYGLAIAAAYHGVPLVVVATEMTIDEQSRSGTDIAIEQRGADEVCADPGFEAADARSEVFNPAFDVTPWHLVSALVTEKRQIKNAAPDLYLPIRG